MSILLATDPLLRELNSRYRGFDKPTDVLSFAQDDPLILGDIVISVDTASRQADAAGWPLASELALLAAHGLLHLMGYEDDEIEGAMEMERLTRSILTKVDIALPSANHPFFQSIQP